MNYYFVVAVVGYGQFKEVKITYQRKKILGLALIIKFLRT